ncbi:type 1 glutamine amidotransferase domain-containing protein [Apilactobacillus timberlakei]|uniref:Type 1 glutamine amidotransferase domain-containing protein n=1 Tax=Apilactobacillus timberlakei TaxID=2008380 RepID=A0ABY2YZ80_9LACO|nr:type 1 glutamine amidotransferase domain-containing protein [Apilactobacillus timberlakei]TPR14880.1 type 1 glutamine amidotransferase domain-containing protein [Apilactobacillus timberlakei]TPR15850.1 type 1 glutamine amidotransferase domain-containing protein [Apilactobacillus timberlakei]TPR16211.1 type 1 glutamine amidotransferase domain-containing protein [Apilactobacillus timberlakei]TPR18953.1 type 1 glutamine amidotransferase domain-containing protein [Apilactobacillus timberlakei]T
MKKILVVLTNTTRYRHTNEPTGLWLGEATEFVDVVHQAGYSVDYVSPKGGFVPIDPRSMKYVNEDIMEDYEISDFQDRALCKSLKPSDINSSEYIAIYYTGGHGVMWDFTNNVEIQNISRTIYNNNGFITSVCHGIAGLLNIRDGNGKYLINKKNVTGFTKAEEMIAGKLKLVPFFNQEIAEQHGAIFKKRRAYKEFVVQDGHIITGQNPFSAKAVAKMLISNLNN